MKLVGALLVGCAPSDDGRPLGETTSPETEPVGTSAASTVPIAPPAGELVFVAAGDVSFGRALGDMLLADPAYDFFAPTETILRAADVRFVNLESQLSDQNGRTVHPDNRLVFTGPPAGADALARGRIDVVSFANNHAWDFGKPAFLETRAHLERVGVDYAGAGRTRERAYSPVIVERAGFRLALLAVTDIWKQG
jgi:poly-gamma-glutamate synthesis protein (capsule biosynthesis protein)